AAASGRGGSRVVVPWGHAAPGSRSGHCPMSGPATPRLRIGTVAFGQAPPAVRVLRAHPVGQGLVGSVLASPPGRRIEVSVEAEEFLAAPSVGRVRVEDLAGVVLEEHAVAGEVLEPGIHMLVVVECPARRDLLGGDLVVEY